VGKSPKLGNLGGDDWKYVGVGFSDVNEFVKSLSLDKFKLVAEQRKEFAKRVQELQPKVSNRAIAKALGVNRSTIDRDAGANAPSGVRRGQGKEKGGGANAPAGAAGGRRDATILANRTAPSPRRWASTRRPLIRTLPENWQTALGMAGGTGMGMPEKRQARLEVAVTRRSWPTEARASSTTRT